MARRANRDELIDRRRRERDVGGDRFVDMRIDFELHDQSMLVAGGRWDRRADDYVGETSSGVVVRLHEGQARAVEWFATWLDAHADRRESPPVIDINAIDQLIDSDPTHVYSALFAGGRRAGKTWIAVALCVAYALRFPGAIVWLVAPSSEKFEEIRRYVKDFVAGEWLDSSTQYGGWELCNGSQLLLKSAFGTGDGLKEGKANLILLNEGQMMKSRAYVVSRGAIVDQSGLVLVCANPPVEAKDEQWVSDFAADAAAGERASVYVQFNPLLNPHIDRRALLSLKQEVDERTYQIEVLGLFLAAKDAVGYNWVRIENEREKPDDKLDCTEAFMVSIGEGTGIHQVVGLDVQRFPYIGGPIYRFYGIPEIDSVLAWIVGEVVLSGGDEVEFCTDLYERGMDPAHTLIVCDATGEYQHSRRRNVDSPPPEWSGKGSWDIIRGEGFNRIVAPDRRMRKKNPDIVDRLRAFTSMISSGTGVRRLFCDPKLAPKSAAAIREWKTVSGAPSRRQDVAHLGDGISYPIIRFFPRRLRNKGKSLNPRQVNNLADKIDVTSAIVAPRTVDPQMMPSRASERLRRSVRTRGL